MKKLSEIERLELNLTQANIEIASLKQQLLIARLSRVHDCPEGTDFRFDGSIIEPKKVEEDASL